MRADARKIFYRRSCRGYRPLMRQSAAYTARAVLRACANMRFCDARALLMMPPGFSPLPLCSLIVTITNILFIADDGILYADIYRHAFTMLIMSDVAFYATLIHFAADAIIAISLLPILLLLARYFH